MKYKLSEINISQDGKISVPDIIHFVWVGDIASANIDYIEVWDKTNTDKDIYLWYDEFSSLCCVLHDSIREYVTVNDFENKSLADSMIRNDAFNYIYPRLNDGFTFSYLVVEFLNYSGIPFWGSITITSSPKFVSERIIHKHISDLFTGEFSDFMRYYYYEIILRGNLASASDIVRLIIIYKYGGVYIDMDTLPYTDNVFKSLNLFIERYGYIEDDYLLLFKSKCILKKLSMLDFSYDEYLSHYQDLPLIEKCKYDTILSLIKDDIDKFTIKSIIPLGELFVHKNLLSIGSLKRLKGIYFNNFMFTHCHSKVVKIILRVMNKRYRFLEKNDCIFNFYKGDKEISYLTRILTWRTELITRDYCVTSVLSGPGLIVEVLLGLACDFIDFGCSIEPSEIAEIMQGETFGIAFFQHNLYTPQGVYSSWRK